MRYQHIDEVFDDISRITRNIRFCSDSSEQRKKMTITLNCKTTDDNQAEIHELIKDFEKKIKKLGGDLSVENGSFALKPGDTLLLATDGFHNQIDRDEFVALLSLQPERRFEARELAAQALKNSGKDNITIIIAYSIKQ